MKMKSIAPNKIINVEQEWETETEDVGAASRSFFCDVLLLLTAKANNFAKLFLSLHPLEQ